MSRLGRSELTLGEFADLDDCRMGPAVQDLWMMLAGDRQECLGQLSELMDGYQEFHDFDPRELALIEPLRALRLMHYSAWLARRLVAPAILELCRRDAERVYVANVAPIIAQPP